MLYRFFTEQPPELWYFMDILLCGQIENYRGTVVVWLLLQRHVPVVQSRNKFKDYVRAGFRSFQ